MRVRIRTVIWACAVACAAATAAFALLPVVGFAFRNKELHIALQTTEALISLLAAFLVLGRFHRRAGLDELLLCAALVFLGTANLAFSAIPAVVSHDTTAFAGWSGLFARSIAALLLAAAAFARPVRVSARAQAVALGAAVLLLAGIAAVALVLQSELPRAVPAAADASHFGIHGLLSANLLLGMSTIAFVIAVAGFTRRAERTGDRLTTGLAIACLFAAAARVNYLNFPSAFTEWVSLGDAFALLCYLVILVAAMAEMRSHWRGAAEAAALEERRRVARDLHDGLAQEIASIQRNLRWLDPDNPFVGRALSAAERALADARRAIDALSGREVAPFATTLEEVARSVAEREGVALALKLEPIADVEPSARRALSMITSEAITNAARHGQADIVRLELSNGRRVRLCITDDGVGFEVGKPSSGLGVITMAERAGLIGAHLQLRSQPGHGTRVEVTL